MIERIHTPIAQITGGYIVLLIITISIYQHNRKQKQRTAHMFTEAMDDFWYHISKENSQRTKKFTLQYWLEKWVTDYTSIRTELQKDIPESNAKKHITKLYKKSKKRQNIYTVWKNILIWETFWIARIFIQK